MKKYIYLVILLFVSSLNFNIFLKPLKLVSGSTNGLVLIINKVTQLDNSIILIIINIIMLLISLKFLEKNTTIGLLITSIIYPLFIKITGNIGLNISFYISLILTSIIAGITNGIIFKLKFSPGGISLLSNVFNKIFNIKLGYINFIINLIVLILGVIAFGFKNIIYSVIIIIVNSLIINLINYKIKF